jgi:hypothetical protein
MYAFVFFFTSGSLKQMLKPSSGYKSGINSRIRRSCSWMYSGRK